jgi:hypothetical protein
MTTGEKGEFPLAFLTGVGIMLLLLGGVYLLTRNSKPAGPIVEEHLPMSDAAKAYAGRIHFTDLSVSRAANFLNQEVTFLFGTVANDGTKTVQGLEVTLEFRDLLNQVVLRETRIVVDRRNPPLADGERREFQLTFERIPAEWNRAVPAITITGLVVE